MTFKEDPRTIRTQEMLKEALLILYKKATLYIKFQFNI